MPTQNNVFARSLRTVAFVVAGATVLWEFAGTRLPGSSSALLAVRLATGAVALIVAFASVARRSPRELSALAYLLGATVVVGNAATVAYADAFRLESAAVLAVTMLGAALFLPWSPRAQVALTIPVALSYPIVALFLAPSPPSVPELTRGVLLVATAATAGILGVRLASRARRLLESAELDRRARDYQQSQERRLDAVSRLAGGMAHQFNNLLAGILTHVEILRQDSGPGPAEKELAEIGEAAKRGRELTDELLRFTRSDPLRVVPTDTARALASIERLARAVLPAGTPVDVDVPPPGGLPPIAADLDHVVHAAMQLILNARDAMRGRPATRLTITAAEETVGAGDGRWSDAAPGRYVRISIGDNGRGMDPAVAERVFEPFFTTKPLHHSTGLGLAIVHRVMRDHQGAVRIESEAGKGTTVHLLLPVAQGAVAPRAPAYAPPALPAPAPAAPATPATQTGPTILIVDDEPIVRNSLRRALTRFGHRVLEAGDGPTALTALQGDPSVELVILDLVLPGGGAGIFELLKAIRPDVKVIVSSGYSPDGEASRGLASRVEGFLPKPYELTELRAALAAALGKKP